MLADERVEKFRNWRTLVAMNPKRYSIRRISSLLGWSCGLFEWVRSSFHFDGRYNHHDGGSSYNWNVVDQLPVWCPK